MASIDGIDSYLSYIRQWVAYAPTFDPVSRVITVDVSGAPAVRLDGAPEGVTVHLISAGAASGHEVINIINGLTPAPGQTWANPLGSRPPDVLRLSIGPFLRQVHFTLKAPLDYLELETANARYEGVRVQTGDGSTDVVATALSIEGGAVILEGTRPPVALALADATESHPASWRLTYLYLEGTVRLGSVSALRTVILGQDEVQLARISGHLGVVGSRDNDPIRMRVQEDVDVSLFHVPMGSLLNLEGGRTRVAPLPGTSRLPNLEGVSVRGWGSVHVDGILRRADFGTQEQPVDVFVGPKGQLLEASGVIALDASPGAICDGRIPGPIQLTSVSAADGAELANVDIYRLNVDSLAQLRSVERFSPWIPDRDTANEMQDRMDFGTTNPRLRAQRSAHFWTRLADIVQEANASGLVQSRVRFAAARARHRSAEGVERQLLWLYRHVGYGEAILRPLVWLVLVAFVGAVLTTGVPSVIDGDFCCERVETFGRTIHRLILAPFAFARSITGEPREVGLWGHTIGILFGAINSLLLFLSVSAARRMGRGE